MAIPNIVNVATIHAESVVGDLGTTLTTTLLTGEAEHVYKINVFRVTNVTDNDATVTADLEKAPGIGHNLSSHLEDLKTQMLKAAENLQFEEAARLRDQIQKLEKTELEIKKDPFAR